METPRDDRIAVVFAAPLPGDCLLVEGDLPVPPGAPVHRFEVRAEPGHLVGCACCAPRSAAAEALRRLFLAWASGQTRPFTRVVVCVTSAAAAAAVRQALVGDAFAAARFRLDEAPAPSGPPPPAAAA